MKYRVCGKGPAPKSDSKKGSTGELKPFFEVSI
jgi:hypothetical protein